MSLKDHPVWMEEDPEGVLGTTGQEPEPKTLTRWAQGDVDRARQALASVVQRPSFCRPENSLPSWCGRGKGDGSSHCTRNATAWAAVVSRTGRRCIGSDHSVAVAVALSPGLGVGQAPWETLSALTHVTAFPCPQRGPSLGPSIRDTARPSAP